MSPETSCINHLTLKLWLWCVVGLDLQAHSAAPDKRVTVVVGQQKWALH